MQAQAAQAAAQLDGRALLLEAQVATARVDVQVLRVVGSCVVCAEHTPHHTTLHNMLSLSIEVIVAKTRGTHACMFPAFTCLTTRACSLLSPALPLVHVPCFHLSVCLTTLSDVVQHCTGDAYPHRR